MKDSAIVERERIHQLLASKHINVDANIPTKSMLQEEKRGTECIDDAHGIDGEFKSPDHPSFKRNVRQLRRSDLEAATQIPWKPRIGRLALGFLSENIPSLKA